MSIDVGKYQLNQSATVPGEKKRSALTELLQRDIRLPGQGWNDKRTECVL